MIATSPLVSPISASSSTTTCTRDVTDRPFGIPVTTPDQLAQARSRARPRPALWRRPGRSRGQHLLRRRRCAADARADAGVRAPPVANLALDGFDLPRKGPRRRSPWKHGWRQIPDPRNDENLAIGQTRPRLHALPQPGVRPTRRRGHSERHAIREGPRDGGEALPVDAALRLPAADRRSAIVDDVFTNGRKVFEVGATGTRPCRSVLGGCLPARSFDDPRFVQLERDISVQGGPSTISAHLKTCSLLGTSGNLSPGSDVDNPLDGRSNICRPIGRRLYAPLSISSATAHLNSRPREGS